MAVKKWTIEQLKHAVSNSNNITQVLKVLNLSLNGRTNEIIKKYINRFNIDTSHFINKKRKLPVFKSKVVDFSKIFIKDSPLFEEQS